MSREGATLVLLTGGRSSRMGVDKATLDAGGMPLAARPVTALAGLCDEVVLAGRAVPGIEGRVVTDALGAEGPLAGIVAGLLAARRRLCVVAACDMPAIDPGVVALLLDAAERLSGTQVAVCAGASSLLEPLPLATPASAAPAFGAALAAGVRSIRGAIERLRVEVVPAAAWRAIDPAGRTFESWNSPADVRDLEPPPPPSVEDPRMTDRS